MLALVLCGCAVGSEDLQRWESTLEGPKRLRAVVLHDKYDHGLRVEAAMALIRMKPRKGQRVGIKLLVEDTLPELSTDVRQALLAELIPRIAEELKKPLPEKQANQPMPPDPSFKFKDAAYMMLTYERTQLVPDDLKKELLKTLTEWAMADFERRLNDRSQDYGMEQLLRFIGSTSVVGIPKLMTKETKNLAKMAELVAKLGDQATKEEASKQLVKISSYTSSKQWREDKREWVKEANSRASFDPTPEQFEKQLLSYQEEAIVRIFASMKKVGGEAVVEHCLAIASDKKVDEKQRQTALAALEGHISRNDPKQLDRLLSIAKSDAPGVVLDQAFRRIRDLPRDKVVEPLYNLFKTDDWKLRRIAAGTILQMSTVKDVKEFLDKLSQLATKNLSLSEVITYGALLGELKGGDVRTVVDAHLGGGGVPSRLSAIAYYYTHGLKKDVPTVKPHEEDKQKIPKCEEDKGCEWFCMVGKEKKPVETVGEFVSFCIEPKMLENKPPKADKKNAEEPKKDGTEGK